MFSYIPLYAASLSLKYVYEKYIKQEISDHLGICVLNLQIR